MTTTPALSFTVSSTLRFAPRLGTLILVRDDLPLTIETPSIITTTSRGTVPHLSRDHVSSTTPIRWLNFPFETFLEVRPPVPTVLGGNLPLHSFCGFSKNSILSLSLRNPADNRILPANGKNFVSAYCVQGVRKVTPADWRSYILACKPDFAVALSDTPFTSPPHSQKRLTKSIERSALWLTDLLTLGTDRPHILAHMEGGTVIPARRAFAESLTELLHGQEAQAIQPLKCLDDGLSGYVFDVAPLRLAIAEGSNETEAIIPLIQASLSCLPTNKPRIVNTARSPHQILQLIQNTGVDMFDAEWAQRAADVGVALDFTFPVAPGQGHGKRVLGHNLYDLRYEKDFSSLADCFRGEAERTRPDNAICLCAACSPKHPESVIPHSTVDVTDMTHSEPGLPFTRAYIHHLLHTHEMSAHTLLALHNLTVLDAMFAGIRSVIQDFEPERFAAEVDRFVAEYDETLQLFEESEKMFKDVDLARGKGRLARERNAASDL